MWPFRKKDPIRDFWRWFQSNEPALLKAGGREQLFLAELAPRLRAIDPVLTWQVGPENEVPRELVISADGIRAAFKTVENVVDAAPALPRWNLIRFRPRLDKYADCELSYKGMTIRGVDIETQLTTDGTLLGVYMFIRGCPSEGDKAYSHHAYLLLDLCLGEYDVECKVGEIRVLPWESTLGHNRIPWPEFREAFDATFDQL